MVPINNECFLSAVLALLCFFSYTEHIISTRLPFFVEAVATGTDIATATDEEDDTTKVFWHGLTTTESPVVEEAKNIIWDIQVSTPNEEIHVATSSFNWHEPSLLESTAELEEVKDEDVNGAVEVEEAKYLQGKDPCEEEPIRALRLGSRVSIKSRVSHICLVHDLLFTR